MLKKIKQQLDMLDTISRDDLNKVEQIRWEYVQKHKSLIRNQWRTIFKDLKDGASFYGYLKKAKVCFKYSQGGISHVFLSEKDDGQSNAFVRCLSEEELLLFINSTIPAINLAVQKRLRGDAGYEPIPFRQDLVDLYDFVNRRSTRIFRVSELCTKIISECAVKMFRRIDYPRYCYDPANVTLCINDRLYLFLKGELVLKPEDENYIFFPEDVTVDRTYNTEHLSTATLTAIKEKD